MYEYAHELVDTLITKTKSRNLQWLKYDASQTELKPEKISFFESSQPIEGPIIPDDSYVADCGGMFCFLIMRIGLFDTPYLTLYVQTKNSAHSKFCASTSDMTENVNIIVELKRLYNLVESLDDPIDECLRAFINK